MIKNNINDFVDKTKVQSRRKASIHAKAKAAKVVHNDKENKLINKGQEHSDSGCKEKNTEQYDLNKYCSAANLNAFGAHNFKLGIDFNNITLSKNRSRENTGFGSPTLRKVDCQRDNSKNEFDSIMAKHGLLQDLKNLNSFNEFCKQSPLRHQRSLDYCYQSTNSSLYPGMQGVKHMKTCTQNQADYNTWNLNSGSPNSGLGSLFSPNSGNKYILPGGKTMDSNTGGYSFPFQRRARSASPLKDPDVSNKIAATLSPRHTRENNTSAVDDMLDDQIMGIQNPLKSLNAIH